MSASVSRRTRGTSFHAVLLVLNEQTFLEASLRSIYPHATGITVVTSYDHDRFDRRVEPDGTVSMLLSRALDPDAKVNVIVAAEGSEPALRNRAMAFASLPPGARPTGPDPRAGDRRVEQPDWFWIVDADEIYDDADVARLKRWITEHPARAYRLHAFNYWRSWNWRIEEREPYLVLVRPGRWFGSLRHLRAPFLHRVAQKLAHERLLPPALAARLQGERVVPRDVAVFHHGSYLGDRARIATKFGSSGHRDDVAARWLDDVWDAWTPDRRDLHPVDPPNFPRAVPVATAALPAAIREHRWPAGWLATD